MDNLGLTDFGYFILGVVVILGRKWIAHRQRHHDSSPNDWFTDEWVTTLTEDLGYPEIAQHPVDVDWISID